MKNIKAKDRRPKTKDELLLNQISEWWSCIRANEISEGLRGASGTDPEDVKKFYPEYFKESVDEDDIDEDDSQAILADTVRIEVRDLIERIRKTLK